MTSDIASGMPTKQEQVRALARRTGLIRARDLKACGIPPQHLKRLVDRGEVLRLGRGLYMLPDAEITEHHDLAEACKRVPHGVVCLASALQFHHLTTQIPVEVWMMLDRGAWQPRLDTPPVRFFRASGKAFTEGVEEHTIEGVTVRVYSVAKTVADCFKYRSRVGLDLALEALRECLRPDPHTRHRPCTREELRHYARLCRVETVMRPYLDAMAVTL